MEEIIKAFISYSQDSDELKDKIKELNDKLKVKVLMSGMTIPQMHYPKITPIKKPF